MNHHDYVLHHFDASPFAERIRLCFGSKGLAWKSVDAELIMPKPKLTALTGGYRKTPVLQIGADIYCDSRLIALELEERAPTPTLFPHGHRGLSLALSAWSDHDFHLASSGLSIGANKHLFPEALMRDRKETFGDYLKVETLDADLAHMTTQLRAHVELVEQQLSDGRRFLLGADPGLDDFRAYAEVTTAPAHVPAVRPVLEPFAHVRAWEQRVRAIGHGQRTNISAEEAHAIARAATPAASKGVDATDALGLTAGQVVEVTPEDFARLPVSGELVTLTVHEVAVRREDPIAGAVVVHFPRIGFRVRAT